MYVKCSLIIYFKRWSLCVTLLCDLRHMFRVINVFTGSGKVRTMTWKWPLVFIQNIKTQEKLYSSKYYDNFLNYSYPFLIR